MFFNYQRLSTQIICSLLLLSASFAAAQYFVGPPSSLSGGGYNNNNEIYNYSVVHRLVWSLFARYHKAATLVKPVIINLDVLLIKVKGTVEKEGIFETVIALFIRWNDGRLTWDPDEYENITSLSLEPEQIGLPDIAMINSADHLYGITRHNKFQVQLSSNGNLKYVPTGTARTWCDLKLFTFPFDVQKCSLEFESWSLDHKSMTFDGLSDIVLDKAFVSQLWTICDLQSTTYDQTYFTNETFTRVRFDITVKRRQTFYVVNLIFPCTTLSLIQLSVFWISSTDTTADRIGFSTTNLLTLVVFQTIVTEELPKTSDAVTALSKYIIALILTSAIGIFESVIIERFFRTFQKPPPWWLFRLLKPLPNLWRELPVTHPDLEEAEQICLSMRRSRKEEKSNKQKQQRNKQQQQQRLLKVKVKPRPTNCTSPCFSRRSSLLSEVVSVRSDDERTRLLKTSCTCWDNMSTASTTGGTIVPTNYSSAVNQGYIDDESEGNLIGRVTIPLIALPPERRPDSVEDDGVFTWRQSSNVNNNSNKTVCNLSSSAGSSMLMNKSKNCECDEEEACSEYGEVITTNHQQNIGNTKTRAFFFHRNTNCTSQRLITLPALSPRLQEKLHQQQEEPNKPSEARPVKRRILERRTSCAPNVIMEQLQERNACLWMELAFKLDFVTFSICLMLSIFIPVGLFAPLIYLGNSCIPSTTFDS